MVPFWNPLPDCGVVSLGRYLWFPDLRVTQLVPGPPCLTWGLRPSGGVARGVVTLALYPLTSLPGPWRRREDGGGPFGCLPEIRGLPGLVKAGKFRGGIMGLSEATRAFSH